MLSQVEKEIPELEEQLRSIKGTLHDFNVSEPLYVHTFNEELVHAEVLCLFPHFCIRFLKSIHPSIDIVDVWIVGHYRN